MVGPTELNGDVIINAGDIRVENTANAILTLEFLGGASIALEAGFFAGRIVLSDHPLRVLINGDEKLRVDTLGNVGIGTTTPNFSLHVEETGDGVGRVLSLQRKADSNSNLQEASFNLDPTNAVFNLDVGGPGNSSARIHLGDLNTSSNDVTMLGDVGIGTTTPGEKLDVQGEIRFDTGAEFPFYPAAYDRKTVMVAGQVTVDGSPATGVTTSGGFVGSARSSVGHYAIAFAGGTFAVTPIVTVTPFDDGGNNRFAVLDSVTTTTVNVLIRDAEGSAVDAGFNFIAIGER